MGTVDLAPGQTADVAFIAHNPGNWELFCNVLDHQMNLNESGPGGLIEMVRYQGFTGGEPRPPTSSGWPRTSCGARSRR